MIIKEAPCKGWPRARLFINQNGQGLGSPVSVRIRSILESLNLSRPGIYSSSISSHPFLHLISNALFFRWQPLRWRMHGRQGLGGSFTFVNLNSQVAAPRLTLTSVCNEHSFIRISARPYAFSLLTGAGTCQ